MMQLTPRHQRRPQRPIVTPLDGPDELAVRRALVAALINASVADLGWADAERQALDLLDALRADGYEILRVTWR